MVWPLRDSTVIFARGKAVVILLASSLKARLCVRTFVVCWLVSTVGGKKWVMKNKIPDSMFTWWIQVNLRNVIESIHCLSRMILNILQLLLLFFQTSALKQFVYQLTDTSAWLILSTIFSFLHIYWYCRICWLKQQVTHFVFMQDPITRSKKLIE